MGWFNTKSKMKSLGEHKGLTVLEVGEQIYLMLPTLPTDRVIVSAHGGYDSTAQANTFTLPAGMTMNFFSDHGYSVSDPGLTNFYQQEAIAKETLRGGEICYNYALSKYQGSHNNTSKETYESISKAVDTEMELIERVERQLEAAKAKNNVGMSRKLAKDLAKSSSAAVLTVRNRSGKADVHLRYMVEQVQAVAPALTYWDCLFCRSFYVKKPPSQTVEFVKRGW